MTVCRAPSNDQSPLAADKNNCEAFNMTPKEDYRSKNFKIRFHVTTEWMVRKQLISFAVKGFSRNWDSINNVLFSRKPLILRGFKETVVYN